VSNHVHTSNSLFLAYFLLLQRHQPATDNMKLLQAGEHGGAGICDMHRSRLFWPTAFIFLTRKAPESNTALVPS